MSRADLINEQFMSRRARFYLLVAAGRHIIIGLLCVFDPASFSSGSYQGVIDALAGIPLGPAIVLWGYLFLVTGAACLFAAIVGKETAARAGLLFSVVTTACWAGGFFASIYGGTSAGYTGAVIWTAVFLKDATMLRQPLRNPFEPLIQKVTADLTRRDK
ncbi:hypothetical protein [Arthrobacter burdickii]|uniref:Uncharacterized protein n=1 Tax=Arthrobacter burdickii TaxID=3035920 RepID=A0ABT8K4K0_9MICC|nr:hypothetical protein [Arthrobacter burdickii]MDN4611962.1 hypothetical protein [Arthrobacter burdickii]